MPSAGLEIELLQVREVQTQTQTQRLTEIQT